MEVRPNPEGFDQLHVSAPEWDAVFVVSGACPVQAFGTVRRRELYFRARHEGWWFEVADNGGNMPSDGYLESDGFYREGIYQNSGYMPLEEAVALIAKCLREYAAPEPGAAPSFGPLDLQGNLRDVSQEPFEK